MSGSQLVYAILRAQLANPKGVVTHQRAPILTQYLIKWFGT